MPDMAAATKINAKMPPMISNANIAMILCKPRPSAINHRRSASFPILISSIMPIGDQ
jgi:hypothetical protein